MATKKTTDKPKSSEDILKELEKRHGLSAPTIGELIIVPTGSLQLNVAMKIGGTALGKMVEIFGMESSGKSTIVLHQMAEYQRAFPDKKVAYIDYENSFDPKYARAIGVNMENLLVYQPVTQEQGYDMIVDLVTSGLISCIVVDSQTAAQPKAMLEKGMDESTIGLQARNNSKFCLKIKGLLNLHKCTLFFVSQLREKIGSMGDPAQPTGGNAIKFYSDVRWKVWKMNDKENEQNKTTVDVIKSKLEKPFGQAKFNIVWGQGIDTIGEIIEYGKEFGLVNLSGSFYSLQGIDPFMDEKKYQGISKFRDMLDELPELTDILRKKVEERLKGFPQEEDTIIEETINIENL